MAFLISIITFLALVVLIYLALNTSRNKRNNVEIEVERFESMLKQEGLSDGLIDFCLVIIRNLQREEGSLDTSIISNDVVRRLNGWEYSKVLPESYYDSIYSRHLVEINRLHEIAMEDYGFLPSDVGEGEHTKKWSESARFAEVAVTQKISDVMNRYKRGIK